MKNEEAYERVIKALKVALTYSGVEWHRGWVLDQMVRELTGKRYKWFIFWHNYGVYGLNTYKWTTGIPLIRFSKQELCVAAGSMIEEKCKKISVKELRIRIKKAVALAYNGGGIDGDHHKMFVIDQMLRIFTACPIVKKSRVDCNNIPYEFQCLGESLEYCDLIRWFNENGGIRCGEEPWDVGIAL